MPRVLHFEIHASDPERGIKFYEKVFGWTFQKWEGPMDYWLITTGEKPEPGIDGGLLPRRGPAPTDGQAVNAFVCTVDVKSLDADVEKVTTLGGTMAFPKMPIPSVGWLAYGKDPDGNLFGMMEADASAK